MIVAKTIHVRCVAQHCDDPADADVPVEQVAAGVVARPQLLCQGCGCEVQEVRGA